MSIRVMMFKKQKLERLAEMYTKFKLVNCGLTVTSPNSFYLRIVRTNIRKIYLLFVAYEFFWYGNETNLETLWRSYPNLTSYKKARQKPCTLWDSNQLFCKIKGWIYHSSLWNTLFTSKQSGPSQTPNIHPSISNPSPSHPSIIYPIAKISEYSGGIIPHNPNIVTEVAFLTIHYLMLIFFFFCSFTARTMIGSWCFGCVMKQLLFT